MFGMMTKDNGSANALDLLKRDHDQVDAMFNQYEDIKDDAADAEKKRLVAQICDALTVHAQIEESIFYPAARKALKGEDGKDLLDEAAVEHQSLKDIIARLEAAPTKDPLYDAGVKVLSEYVKHHVKEEENELFPKVRSSGMDLQAIGEELEARKEQLEARGTRTSGGARGSGKRGTESRTSRGTN